MGRAKRRRVILTRPEGANESLADRLLSSHNVIVLPMISLSAVAPAAAQKTMAMNLDGYDKVVFVSRSGVRFGLPLIENYWPQWPVQPAWFAVGPGTAKALAACGVRAAFPKTAGSEGLLALPGFGALPGQRVLIVRGQGGRELLGRELQARGAWVDYLEVYQREPVIYDDLVQLVGRGAGIAVLTSVEILDNFRRQLDDQVAGLCAVVPSARIAQKARAAGFAHVQNAAAATERALYDAVFRCHGVLPA